MVRVSDAAEGPYKVLRDIGDSANWQNLNGLWEWEPALDVSRGQALNPPFGRTLNQSILVPFPVESCLSGVAPQAVSEIHTSMWYRLTFAFNGPASSNVSTRSRVILHFGAVDWQSSFFVNGRHITNHTGGYDAIDIDITDAIVRDNSSLNELLVYAHDPSSLGDQPNGKQNHFSSFFPGGGQYTPSSGIWQTVWMEIVPRIYISSIQLRQNSLDTVTITATAGGAGAPSPSDHNPPTMVRFSVFGSDSRVVIATAAAPIGDPVALQIPSPQQWSPSHPHLYDFKATILHSPSGPDPLDSVVGYFGLRSIRLGVRDNTTRPLLNGNFTFLAGWLDQSWWPDGQYTAPTDAALASDLHAVSVFGFNMARLHMKVNPERWYYHADTLGVVVFQDMVQKICTTNCSQATLGYYLADLRAMIDGRKNHPCIVQFTLLNEMDMWMLFDTPPFDLPGLLHFARTLAPEHLINVESGANGKYGKVPARSRLGDVRDYHTYPAPALEPHATATQYAMVGEFGGVGAFVAGKEWRPPTPKQKSCFAYNLPLDPLATPADEAQAYIAMTSTLRAWSDQVSASVYTQITDVELECDGFLNYDRTNKFDDASTAAIRQANRLLVSGT